MKPLRRLWNRRPWRPKREPSVMEQWADRLGDEFYKSLREGRKITWNEITLEKLQKSSNLTEHELIIPLDSGLDWKEDTLVPMSLTPTSEGIMTTKVGKPSKRVTKEAMNELQKWQRPKIRWWRKWQKW